MVNYDFYTKLIEYLTSTFPVSNVIFDKREEVSSESSEEGKLEVKALDDKINELISN